VPGRYTRRTVLVAAPAVLVLVVQAIAVRPVFVDDAYIFHRYADNWASGLGPVFNRGEYVEGFSSFIWLVLLTIPAALGIAPEDAAPVLGLAAAVGTVALVATAVSRLLPDHAWLAAAAALAVALPTGLPYYAASGMDAPLFALVLTAAVVATAGWVERARAGAAPGRATAVACALLVALVLVRAEGAGYAIVIAAAAVWLARSGPRGIRGAVPIMAAVGASVVAVLAVRIAVYGELVPATVSAKSAVTHLASEALRDTARIGDLADALREGLRYAGRAAVLLVVLVTAGLAWRRRRPAAPPLVVLAAVAVALNFAVAVWSGGDWMPHRRLLVPALPLLAIAAVWTAAAHAAAWRSPRAHAGALVAGLLACVLVVAAVGLEPRRISRGDRPPAADQLEDIGRAAAAAPDTDIVTNVAGALPYRAGPDRYVWDLLGLTDSHNATQGDVYYRSYGRTDYDYSYSRPFDLYVSNSPADLVELFRRLSLAERDGPLAYLDRPAWRGQGLDVVVRRDRPIAAELERRCGCPALDLTPASTAQILERVQALTRQRPGIR
jgi:arabinofuranosyltransferase